MTHTNNTYKYSFSSGSEAKYIDCDLGLIEQTKESTFEDFARQVLSIESPVRRHHKNNQAFFLGISETGPQDRRSREKITKTNFLVIDADSTDGALSEKSAPDFDSSVASFREAFPDLSFAAHTTISNIVKFRSRWRLIVPLSRSVDSKELTAIYLYFVKSLHENGCMVSAVTESKCTHSIWFAPSETKGYQYDFHLDGDEIEVDGLLAKINFDEKDSLALIPQGIVVNSRKSENLSDKANAGALRFIREELKNDKATIIDYAIHTGKYELSRDNKLKPIDSDSAAGIYPTDDGCHVVSFHTQSCPLSVIFLSKHEGAKGSKYDLIDMITYYHPAFQHAHYIDVQKAFADYKNESSHPLQTDFFSYDPSTRINDFVKAKALYNQSIANLVHRLVEHTRKNQISSLKVQENFFNTTSLVSPSMPIDALPSEMYGVASEVAEAVTVDVSLAALSMLAHLSVCAQRQVKSMTLWSNNNKRIKQESYPVFWAMIVADSGERKSAIDGVFKGPIREYANESKKKFKQSFASYKKKKDIIDKRVKAIDKALDKEYGKIDDYDDAKVDSLLEKREEVLSTNLPQLPIREGLILSNSGSLQGWAKQIDRAKVGIISSSEAGQVLGSHGAQNQTVSLLSMFNELWSPNPGAIDITVKNDDDAIESTDEHALALCLSMQSNIFDGFKSAENNMMEGIGSMARFTVCRPRSLNGERSIDHFESENEYNDLVNQLVYSGEKGEGEKYINGYKKVVEKMLQCPLRQTYFEGKFSGPALIPSRGALGLFTKYREELEKLLRIDEGPSMTAFKGKLAEKVCRVATLFEYYLHYYHNMDKPIGHVVEELNTLKVSERAMFHAIEFAKWDYRCMQLEVKPEIDEDTEELAYISNKVWNYIINNKNSRDGTICAKQVIYKATILQSNSKRVPAKLRKKALDYLESENMISVHKEIIYYNVQNRPDYNPEPYKQAA